MFGGISHKLSMLSKKGGEDVTPNQFIFRSGYDEDAGGVNCWNSQNLVDYFDGQITGINKPITLKLQCIDDNLTVPFIYYRVSQTSAIPEPFGPPLIDAGNFAYQADINNDGNYYLTRNMGTLEDGITLTVSNGDYVGFAILLDLGFLKTFELINISDNNSILDTISVIDLDF
jgi:hypothetical protein